MKTYIITALIAAAAPAVMADISLGTNNATGTPDAPSAEVQSYLNTANAVIQSFKELTGTLGGITDQASADAAASLVSSQVQKLLELQAKAEATAQPSSEISAQLLQHINVQEVQETVNAFMDSIIRLGMTNAYGSGALLQALSPLMNALPNQ